MSLHKMVMAGCLVAALAGAAVAADKPEDAAQAAAESWLKLVDDGNYAASWDQAATMFKGAVTRADWVKIAGDQRIPLGKLVSRKLKSREYTENVPGAPEGRYVIVHYDTEFGQKASADEMVPLQADPAGVWRVGGD